MSAENVNIINLPKIDEIKDGQYLIVETDTGTQIIDFKYFIISQDNTTFEPLLSSLSTDTRDLSSKQASLSAEITEFKTTVSDVSALSGVIWKGDWSSSAVYEPSEAVFYRDSSFIAKTDNENQMPIDTSKTLNSAYWDYLAKGTVPSLSAKGDLLIGIDDGSKRLPIGPAGYVLKARSTGNRVAWQQSDTGRAGSVCSSLITEDGNAQVGSVVYGMCYLMSNNTVKAVYGKDGAGLGYQPVGVDVTHYASNPHPVTMPSEFDYDNDIITSVQRGLQCTFIVTDTGKVFATGSNGSGQLGVGDTTIRHVFEQIIFPDSGVKIDKVIVSYPADFSSQSTYFLTKNDGTTNNDGRVYACGKNTTGQLGDGTTTDRTSPVRVGSLINITNVWATGGTIGWAFASKATGEFYSWGEDSHNGYTGADPAGGGNRSTPTLQTGFAFGATTDGLHAVTKVIPVFGKTGSTFHSSTFALLSSGHIYHIGDNAYYQGGTASNADATTWTLVGGLSGVLDFDVNYAYRPTIIASCSAIEGGSYDGVKYKDHTDKTSLSGIKLVGWGHNGWGQLGLGNTTQVQRATVLNETLPEPLRYAVKLGSVKLQTACSDEVGWAGMQDSSGNLYFAGSQYGGKFAKGVTNDTQADNYLTSFERTPIPCPGNEIKTWIPIAINAANATDRTGANLILTNDGRVFVAGNYVDFVFGAGYSGAESGLTPYDGWKQVMF